MKSQSKLETYSNHLKVMKSFQINSSLPLQFVITRTFVSLLDRVTKAVTINGETPDIYELDEEEDILRENLRYLSTEDINEFDNDDENFSPSFNFLVKNELGVDILFEAISGFKFYNVSYKPDLSKGDRYIDKITLKNDESYPITQAMHKCTDNLNILSHSTLEEQTKAQYKLMKFKIDVSHVILKS